MWQQLGLLILFLMSTTACGQIVPFRPTSTATPTVTPVPLPSPIPSITPTVEPPDTGWQLVKPGFCVRSLPVATQFGTERVTIARIDPAAFQFRIYYTPGEAQLISEWAAQTGALLTLNAAYFAEDYTVTGLTIVDGQAYGYPYDDFAGMLSVAQSGEVDVRWLRTWPYDATEPLISGVQSFPVLVKPGGVMGFPEDADAGLPARRTVVAQSYDGLLLLLVAPRGHFNLHTLATWLTEMDLDIDVALNLDGGTSSGLWLNAGQHPVEIDSYSPVPVVITVE